MCIRDRYLGFVINEAGIAPNKEEVEEIIASKAPKTVKQVRSLLGLCNFYRAHIPAYAQIVEPIVHLTRK